ncbi:uncharacterized protein LOC127286479 [Leptopilina boulardi]|uniref:uncharacterized protein LOC127286479 n=1 Tax=Leptopilina boulardi TaxID=63433 RepID=UPI0021F60D7F|nr:uncharacterized protein LOC127286479 [Leptopilina boulardi]
MTLISQKTCLNNYVPHLFDTLQFLGIYKSEKKFPLALNIFTQIIISGFLSANLCLILSELIDFKNAKNARELATRIGPVSLHITGLMKWCFCTLNINKITHLLSQLKQCYFYSFDICTNSKEKEEFHNEMELARKRSKLFIILWPALGMSGALHYCCNPLSFRLYKIYIQHQDSRNVSKILPINGWFPWDDNNYFGYSYILQIFGVLGCCVGSVSYDQLYVSTLIIISAFIKHLLNSLQFQNVDIKSSRGDVTQYNCFETRLKKCAIQYAEVLNFLEELEKVGSPCMFVQCVQNIIILCLSSFEAATLDYTMDAECILKILTMIEFVSAITIQLFFFCFVATHIKSLGFKVADAAYACEWVSSFDTLELKNKKFDRGKKVKYLILMVTIRSQRPILLTGGPFYILSLETFKAIIGLAISNAVILSQVYKG